MIDELQRAGCDGATLTLGCCSTRYVPFISCLPASSTGCVRSKIGASKSGAGLPRRFQLQTGARKKAARESRRRSLDRPLLAEFAQIAGNDYHLTLKTAKVEALATRRIEDLARSRVEPPLCDGPVALEYLDKRSVSRSAYSHI